MKTKKAIYMPVIVWSIALILSTAQSYSQTGEIQFERISIESGLSESSVLCIYQDSKGFLWFGTYAGLNRYDGYTFKVYKNDPENPFSLSNNNIEAIIEDHLGTLWVGTESGLNRFDRGEEKFIHYKNNPNDSNSLSTNYIRSIYEDRSGTLWVGTQGGGLNQFDRINQKFIRYINDPNNPKSLNQNNVVSILEDRHGRLWIGTDGGLNYFDRNKGEFIHYKNDPHDPHSISNNSIGKIYEDRAGNLWIGTWLGGLNLFDPQKNLFVRYQNNPNDPNSLSNNHARSIYEDHNGNLWIGTGGGGLNRFVGGSKVGEKGRFVHYKNNPQDPASLSSNSVLSIFEDRFGILWIGTSFKGINKYDPGKRQFMLYKNSLRDPNSLSANAVDAIYEDSKEIIWIGTNGGGLNRFDRKKNQFIHFVNYPRNPRSLSNDVVRSICEDRYHRLWVGTDNGLNRFDPFQNNFIIYRPNPTDSNSISYSVVFSLYKDRAENIWAGTTRGLNRFDDKKEKFFRYINDKNNLNSLINDFIWTIYEDTSDIFWIGTNLGGLHRFDPEKETFFHYQSNSQNPFSISDNKVICLHEDRNGMIWLGTSNGLNKFDRNTGTFHRYYERDGLPDNSIQGMLEDDHGNLWIGTNHGLSKFDPRTIKFKNYYESYGLQSNEFGTNACCKLKSGEMVFGGVNGFNIFHPDSIHADTSRPSVVITDFQIFNKPVPIGEGVDGRTILQRSISECDEIHLSYKENVFSFEFAGLHYVSPKGNLYAYIMEGFDKEWNYTDANRRFVTYTNLPGGTYTFRVKASNNQGTWNEEGTSIRIIITPPFWKTMWFYGLLLVVIGGMVYWIFQWRMQARDLAAKRRMEAALTKERNLLRTIIDVIPEQIYVKDLACRKTIANLADVNSMGLHSEAEVLGKDDFELFPKEIAEGFIADDRTVIQTGHSVMNREEYMIDGQGQKHWLLTSKLPLYDERGETIGLVGVGRDITESKKAETEREKLIKELQNALADVKLLSGLVPICSNCKKIRDDKGYWTQVEAFIQDRSDARFTHSICPDCLEKLYPDLMKKS